MTHDEDQDRARARPEDTTCLRWRPWPCEGCRGGTTPIGFLVRCHRTSSEIGQIPKNYDRNQVIDWFKKWESGRLLEWVQSCDHTAWSDEILPNLDAGSEHFVMLDENTSEVVKVTLPGTYGDYYEVINGKIHQFDSTPTEYLLRMRWWNKLFTAAPEPMGMTDTGQIVSRQRFIQGEADPPQEDVDRFLVDAGLIALHQRCWLWKKAGHEMSHEIWIGDARSDNFVLTNLGMVPIDLRIWSVDTHSKHLD